MSIEPPCSFLYVNFILQINPRINALDVRQTTSSSALICCSVLIHLLQSDATIRPAAVRLNQGMVSSATQSLGHSPTIPQIQLSALRHLRKLLPSSLYTGAVSTVHTVESCVPLDVCFFVRPCRS